MATEEVVIVTGGAGFIGSHCVLELLQAGYRPVVIDNFSNSCKESIVRVEELTAKKIVGLHEVDLNDEPALQRVFELHSGHITAVIHFAGKKAVGESVAVPLEYYQNNVGGTCVLLKVMQRCGVKNLVFSSSATVYGAVQAVPEGGLTENMPLGATNPYGQTKLFIEQILRDVHTSDPSWNITLLRYFNPVGAHESGRIGEDPQGIPNNLMPYITQVAIGKREHLNIFGNDYPTKDGTGVRDFIHVVDLAKGHIAALQHLSKKPGCMAINLGTGRGCSVLEMVEAMRKASGRPIEYQFTARRPGDVATVYACPEKAKRELGWVAQLGLDKMCQDAWNWQRSNPDGYQTH